MILRRVENQTWAQFSQARLSELEDRGGHQYNLECRKEES